MWPFRKKIVESKSEPVTFNTIICIPGKWQTREELIIKIVAANEGKYIAAGNVMMNADANYHCSFEICEREARMKDSFAIAGRVTRVSEEFLNEIDQHNLVVYISASTGNLDELQKISSAANAILNAGGIGVKIETAGKAFDKEQWLLLTNEINQAKLYEMFVIESITQEDGTVFSCGMQNLGLKDTIVSGLEFQDAVDLIRIFGFYQIVDKPTILAGQTFRATMDDPIFRIEEETDSPYKDEEILGNPFGMWRLSKVSN